MEGISDLLHPRSGYLARQLSSQLDLVVNRAATKPTVVLDVDETILSAAPWTLEVSVSDKIVKKACPKEVLTVTALVIDLVLPQRQVTLVLTSQEDINQMFRGDLGDSCQVIGVQVQSREGQSAIALESLEEEFEPWIKSFADLHDYNSRRPNVSPVSFVYGGLIVRLRPFLPMFLSYLSKNFDVILFTAAPRAIYAKLLRYVEKSLAPFVGSGKLWGMTFFREDCDFSKDEQCYHKNIGKLGVDLSRILIIDDNPLSFRGYEPNAIQIGPFFGSNTDNQLVRVKELLESVEGAVDVRYPICNLTESCVRSESGFTSDSMPTIDETCELGNSDEMLHPSSLDRTIQFLADLNTTYTDAF